MLRARPPRHTCAAGELTAPRNAERAHLEVCAVSVLFVFVGADGAAICLLVDLSWLRKSSLPVF